MSIQYEALLVLPMLTKAGDHTKSTRCLTCVDPYHPLPYSMLAVRNPVVILDWSTNAYQSADLALAQPCVTFTNDYHRGQGQGIKPNAPFRVGQYTQRRGSGCHMGNVVKGYNSR